MSDTNNNVETTITKENIDIDQMFAPNADNVTLPDAKPSIFSKPENISVDSITENIPKKEEEVSTVDDLKTENENKENSSNEVTEEVKEKAEDIFDEIGINAEPEVEDEVKTETRGRKPISGISDVFSSLMKKKKYLALMMINPWMIILQKIGRNLLKQI